MEDKHRKDSFIEDFGLKTDVEDDKLDKTTWVVNADLAGIN